MRDDLESLRRWIPVLRSERGDPAGCHFDDEELIDFQLGRLPAQAQQDIRSHLLACETCRLAFKEVGDFFEQEEEAHSLRPGEVTQQVRALWQRLRMESKPDARSAPAFGRWARTAGRWPSALLAASIASVIALSGWLWSWQHSGQLQRQWQSQLQTANDQLAQARGETRQLRTQQDQTRQELAQFMEQSRRRTPALNVAIVALDPSVGRQAMGTEPAPTTVSLHPGSPWISLLLRASSSAQYPEYGLEITDEQGKAIWTGTGLRRNPDIDGYSVMLPAELLPTGRYRLIVFGIPRGQRTPVERYSIRTTP